LFIWEAKAGLLEMNRGNLANLAANDTLKNILKN